MHYPPKVQFASNVSPPASAWAAFAGDYGDGKIGLACLVATGLAVVAATLGTRLFRQAGA